MVPLFVFFAFEFVAMSFSWSHCCFVELGIHWIYFRPSWVVAVGCQDFCCYYSTNLVVSSFVEKVVLTLLASNHWHAFPFFLLTGRCAAAWCSWTISVKLMMLRNSMQLKISEGPPLCCLESLPDFVLSRLRIPMKADCIDIRCIFAHWDILAESTATNWYRCSS